MDIYYTAGNNFTNWITDFLGYGTVWLYPDRIANIISLVLTKNLFHITYGSHGGNCFEVSKQDSEVQSFVQSPTGLYFLDTAKAESTANGNVLVNTVAGNKYRYTNTEYSKAVRARKTQILMGRPSTRCYMEIIDSHLLKI